MFTNKHVGLMVEEIYGEVLPTNFEDVECGPDPMHPGDNGYSSVKDDDSSDDDEIEERYTDPAAPTRGRV